VTAVTAEQSSGPGDRRIGRSILALLAGFTVGVALSLGTDEVLHLAGVFPPWGQPVTSPPLGPLDRLSHRLRHRRQLHHRAPSAGPAHAARHDRRLRGPAA
jgi:hypothetical protein